MDEKRFFKTFAKKVAKGGVKSLPIVGGVLEEPTGATACLPSSAG